MTPIAACHDFSGSDAALNEPVADPVGGEKGGVRGNAYFCAFWSAMDRMVL